MDLKLYNSLSRSKDVFKPIDANNVRMYVCGPTVYDLAHIGNARPIIVFDVLFRLLRRLYGADHVTYVRNITDVDDKINARAAQEYPGVPLNEAIGKITARTEQQFHLDIAALGVLPPTHEPHATHYIAEMVEMIGQLIASGHAYAAEGHVLFDVSSKADYGKLARRSLDEMMAGARVEVAPYKRNAMDFVLWKPSDEGMPGWESPWGLGRPGWHIECSAMSQALLGETFDIHGGGIDLVFPHHENEIAQSECSHGGAPFAHVWMHNGFLQVEGQKMSKSLGNFTTIQDALKMEHPEVLRLQMLMTDYKKPIDWTKRSLDEARTSLDQWYSRTENVEPSKVLPETFLGALCDDMNTPQAIAVMRSELEPAELLSAARFFGLLNEDAASWKKWVPAGQDVNEAEIDALISARQAARKAKDFAEADRLRGVLDDMSVLLKDGPEGTTWELKR